MEEIRTEVRRVDPRRPEEETISRAAAIIRRGGLVAFPTETVYGLGADALNPVAVRRLFAAKGRPSDNPFILHVASWDRARELVDFRHPGAAKAGDLARELAGRFWPGPLTLVLPRAPCVPPEVTAGLDTVAIRAPAHPVALALIAAAGVPLAGPSANVSGRPSPTTAAHVLADLGGRIEMILDAGPSGVGVESTVLDLTRDPPVILRPGGVTEEALVRMLGKVREASPGEFREGPAPAPGTKYRHYAPRVPLLLCEKLPPGGLPLLLAEGRRWQARGCRVGALVAEEEAAGLPPEWVVSVVGSRARPEQVAARLFGALRQLEEEGVDVILALPFPEEGLGKAIMNRLRKAASGAWREKGGIAGDGCGADLGG